MKINYTMKILRLNKFTINFIYSTLLYIHNYNVLNV